MRCFDVSKTMRTLGLAAMGASLLLAACFKPSLPEVAFRCGVNDECPDDYECRSDGCCHKIGSPDVPADYCAPGPDGGQDDGNVPDSQVIDGAVTDGEVIDGAPGVALATLTPVSGTVTEGQAFQFTVTLTGAAPAGGAVVALSTDAAGVATVPASVTVPEGQTTETFDASGVGPGTANIGATLGNTQTSALTVARATGVAAELVITEFLAISSGGGTDGEFVEIVNVGSFTLDLEGWVVTIDTVDNTIQAADLLGGPVYLAPNARIFGVPNPSNPANIPAGATFVYGTAGAAQEMSNTGSVLSIGDGTVTVDTVDFTSFITDPALTPAAADFPGLAGRSTQLDEAGACNTAVANNNGICWCVPSAATEGAANGACGWLLINEVLVDSTGPDDRREFVELAGVPGANLQGFVIRSAQDDGTLSGLNFTAGAGTRMPMDGLFVLGDNTGGGTQVPNTDVEAGMGFSDTGGGFQLIRPDATLADALGYGALTASTDGTDGLALVETALTDAATPLVVGDSISRDASSTDTDDNDTDFQMDPSPTPGAPNDP